MRIGVSDRDVAAIHHMLVYSMAMGSARAPVDASTSMRFIYETVTSKEGSVALMAFCNGKFVGTMGIRQTQYWYSLDHFLHDTWLYVLPEFENKGVMAALLNEAKAIADMSGMTLYIAPNSRERKRGVRKEHVATIYQFIPAGKIYAFHPQEN